MISAVLFLSFFVFLILNVPIAICLGLSSVCAILYSGTSLTIVATNMYSGISKFLLLAIPFFVLSGNIMAKAGISKRLIKFVNTCVGHRRGGIAIVCVIVACFFGAISGSGPATVAALGAVLIPAMVEEGGFSAPFSTAMMATSSSIAIVIPPSIAFVVYASITGVSIADMFAGGIIPGVLMGLALIVVIMIEVRKKGIQPTTKKASWGERGKAFADAFWGFLMPIIILGGIYGGIFTPTEAAAVSVVYGLFVGMVIYREVKFKDLVDIFVESAKTTGGIMLIVAATQVFGWVLTRAQIPQTIAKMFTENVTFTATIMILMLLANVVFLIFGLATAKISAKVLNVSQPTVWTAVCILCVVGSFALNNTFFDVGVMFAAGVLGFFLKVFKFPNGPFVLGLLLGSMLESNMRRALVMSHGSWATFVTRPVSCVLFIAIVLTFCWPVLKAAMAKKKAAAQAK